MCVADLHVRASAKLRPFGAIAVDSRYSKMLGVHPPSSHTDVLPVGSDGGG